MRVLVAILFLTQLALGANHYILQSATGTGSGADWTNAYTGFGTGAGKANPASLTRGDTYYVGTGTYSLAVINTSNSGALTTTIKGATAADHGTDTGWSSSFGVDVTQAHFTTSGTYSPIGIFIWYNPSGQFILDGNTGTPSGGPTSYGFTVDLPASCSGGNTSVEIGAGGGSVNNVQISHFYFLACSGDVATGGVSVQTTTSTTGLTVSYNYFDGFESALDEGNSGVTMTGTVFDHNYLVNAFSSASHHGNQINFKDAAINPVVSNNIVANCAGTNCIGANDVGTTCTQGLVGAKIYGNVFNATLTPGGTQAVGLGILSATTRCFITNALVYNNTFTGTSTGWFGACQSGAATCSSATGNLAENNVIWDATCALGLNVQTHDYNSYLSCTDTAPVETNGQVASLNPFVAAASNNFHLATDTSAWTTLTSPYNVDPDGVTRTSSRGAYQYASPVQAQYTVTGAVSIQGAITVKLAVCGSPNYPCGNSTSSTINISHPNLGTNGGVLGNGVCDWTSLSTLATCGNTIGANTIITPGDFGSQRLLRLTDCNTLTNCGDVWLSADDGLPTLSNLDSTRWIIKRNGGQRYLASFDPATMQTAGLSAISLDPQESTFSRTTQNVLYQLTGGAGTSKVILKKHVITTNTNPALDSDSVTTIKDLGTDANCFGASFTAAWTSLLLSPAGNDTVFSISASTGSQGSANLTVSYNTSTSQCTVLDTSTGAVTQNGASLGNYTSYSGSTTDLFHPHEAYQTPNSRYVVIVGTSSNYIQGTYNSGFYVWDLQNPLSLKSCLNCSGHFALGANGVVFGKALIFTPYSAPISTGTSTFLPSPPSYPDIHPSWNNGNSGDMLWMLNKAQDDTATPVNPLSGFSVAFFDEIFMVKPDGLGAVSRQHHTFGSSNPNLPFDCQINAANISQDGKWAMWTTDGMGQFGSTSGTGTCTPGTDCRCELVIGELK